MSVSHLWSSFMCIMGKATQVLCLIVLDMVAMSKYSFHRLMMGNLLKTYYDGKQLTYLACRKILWSPT